MEAAWASIGARPGARGRVAVAATGIVGPQDWRVQPAETLQKAIVFIWLLDRRMGAIYIPYGGRGEGARLDRGKVTVCRRLGSGLLSVRVPSGSPLSNYPHQVE